MIAGFWSHTKDVVWKVVSLFIQQIEFESEEAHDALIAHLVAHFPRSRLYDRVYGAWREYHRDGRYGLVAYERFGLRNVVFWDGWRPLVFCNAVERKGKTAKASGENGGAVSVAVFEIEPRASGSISPVMV